MNKQQQQHNSAKNGAKQEKQKQQQREQREQQQYHHEKQKLAAFSSITKLTIILGNVVAANELIHRSSLFLPLEDHLLQVNQDGKNQQHCSTGPLGSTFWPRVELPSNGDDPHQLQYLAMAVQWLTTMMPKITDLAISASLTEIGQEAAVSATVGQIVKLLHCWAPTLGRLRLWLGSSVSVLVSVDEKSNDRLVGDHLQPVWSAVNGLKRLRSLSIDIQETLPGGAIAWREFDQVRLTILEQLHEFNFASKNVCVWEQLLNQPSTASLAILSETSIETLLTLSAETTARFTAISITDLSSADQLVALLSGSFFAGDSSESGGGADGDKAATAAKNVSKFPKLRRLVVNTGEAATFLEVLQSLGASQIRGLQSLSLRLGFTWSLWSKTERQQMEHFLSSIEPSMAESLSTITSLSIETEWLFSHDDIDLSPLPRLFPALQTFKLTVRMSLCDLCPTAFTCAGALLYPMSAGKGIRRMSITLGPERPPMEFATHHH